MVPFFNLRKFAIIPCLPVVLTSQFVNANQDLMHDNLDDADPDSDSSSPTTKPGHYTHHWRHHYCNVEKDWGQLPKNTDFEVKKVIAFVRHGSRLALQGANNPGNIYFNPQKDLCWAGDTKVEFECTVEQAVVDNKYLFHRHRGNDAAQTRYKGNCQVGQLVPDGEEMHRNNGKRLYEAYPQFLNADNSDRWLLRSDNGDRTIKSGEHLATGILEAAKSDSESDPDSASDSDKIKKSLQFYIDGDDSSPLDPWDRCPRVAQIYENFRDPKHVNDPDNKYFKDLKTLFDAPERQYTKVIREKILHGITDGHVAGKNFTGLESLGHLFDCLQQHICPTVNGKNKGIPRAFHEYIVPHPLSTPQHPFSSKSKSNLLDEMLWFTRLEYDIYWAVPEMARLAGGLLLKDVLHTLHNQGKDKDFILYSGHDDGPMAPLESVLYGDPKVYDAVHRRPAYASMIVMEIGEEKIRFLYNGKVYNNKVCGGESGICDKNEFFEKVRKHLIPSKRDCEVKSNEELKKLNTFNSTTWYNMENINNDALPLESESTTGNRNELYI